MNSQKKTGSKSENGILECYYNARIISYLSIRDCFGYGIKRISRLEKSVDKYLDDYSQGIYDSGYFDNRLLKIGIDTRKIVNSIPSRVKISLLYGGKIPKKIFKSDLSIANNSLFTFFTITMCAMNDEMKISAKKIKNEYLPKMKMNFECLAEKNRISIEDVVRVMIDECNYLDPRYLKNNDQEI